jgi:hypothetical protein
LEANIQPLKTQVGFSSLGFLSQICRKAADSGFSIGADLRQARALINSEAPNLTVFSTGTSKVLVRAEILSIVRSTTMSMSSICRAAASGTLPKSRPVSISAARRRRDTI